MISNELLEQITSIRRTDNPNIFSSPTQQLNPYFDIEGGLYFEELQLLL